MGQETTKEFSARLQMAVDGHPLAPDTPFGRQSWLRDKLAREAKLKVSANAIHKWMSGMSRPREDSIRAIARVLNVDELWLSMGKTPGYSDAKKAASPQNATAAALILGGLLEMHGARVLFPGKDDPAHIRVSYEGRDAGIVVVVPDFANGAGTALIPEPVGDLRVVMIRRRDDPHHTACLDFYDLTDAPRQSFGGYSVIQMERRKDGKFKIEGAKNLLPRKASVVELA